MSLDYRAQMYIESLYEEAFNLCEIRGSLDEESNARIEKRLAEINEDLAFAGVDDGVVLS